MARTILLMLALVGCQNKPAYDPFVDPPPADSYYYKLLAKETPRVVETICIQRFSHTNIVGRCPPYPTPEVK